MNHLMLDASERRGAASVSAARRITIVLALAGVMFSATHGADPRIDRIEPFSTNLVLMHFDTEANHSYVLQYTMSSCVAAGTGAACTNLWFDLYKVDCYPFPNHYIIADSRTNQQRFYRLMVSRCR